MKGCEAMEKKRRFFWLLLPILAAAGMLIFVFWDTILLWVAPKYVLKNAVEVRISQLRESFVEDPLWILLEALEPEGKYTADLTLDTDNSLLGSVHYDLEVQTDCLNHHILAQGTASTQDMLLDLALYLSPDCMAVSSEQLVDSACYGLTFDTFRQDLQSIPLLDFFITEKMITQWEAGLLSIRDQMMQLSVPEPFPVISETETETLLLGLLAMPCDVEEVSVADGNTFVKCRGLTYRLHAEEINQFLKSNLLAGADIITATFYLLEDSLIKVQVSISGEHQGDTLELYFGQDPEEDTLRCCFLRNQANTLVQTEIAVNTDRSEEEYRAHWQIVRTEEGETSLGYCYRPSTGAIALTNETTQETARIRLQKKENGFWMESQNFTQLFRIFCPEIQAVEAVSGSVLVTKGSEITPMEYKNLNEWTLEDFWSLLTGLGSLFGISITS